MEHLHAGVAASPMPIDVTAQNYNPSSHIVAPGQRQRSPSKNWRDVEDDQPLLPQPASSQAESEEASTSRQRTWGGAWALIWDSGVFCMAIAAFIQSLAALFVKLTDGRVPVFELVAVRSGLCMAATITLVKMRGISPIFGSPSHLPALLVRGIAGAASMSMYYFAIFILPLADVITLFYTHPAMVVALAWLCKGELVGTLGVLGMLASLLGVMLVAQPPFLTGGSEWSTRQLTGVSLCVGAAFLAAVAFVAIRFVPKTESSFSIALWFHIAGFVSSTIPLLAGWPQPPVLPNPMDMAMMIAIAACSFSSHALIARAFLMDNAAKVSAAGYLQVVFAHMYGIALLHEPESLFGVLGSLVICIGVVAVSWPASKPRDTMAASKFDLVQYSTIPEESTVVEMAPIVADDSGRQSMDKAAERKGDLRV